MTGASACGVLVPGGLVFAPFVAEHAHHLAEGGVGPDGLEDVGHEVGVFGSGVA